MSNTHSLRPLVDAVSAQTRVSPGTDSCVAIANALLEHRVIYFSVTTADAATSDRPIISFDPNSRSGQLTAHTIKPSNIVINLPNLFRLLALAGPLVTGVAAGHYGMILTSVLALISNIFTLAAVDFGAPLSYVLLALWDLRYTGATADALLRRTNQMLISDGHDEITSVRLVICLDSLSRLGCIDVHLDGRYALRETVHLTDTSRP